MNQIMSAFAVLFASRSRLITCTAILLVPLLGCAEATAPLPTGGVPAALRFTIGGYEGGRHWDLRGDTLVFRRITDWPSVSFDTVRVIPTAEAWTTFWAAAEQAGVARWRGRYVAEHIADGLAWGLHLAAGAATIDASGSNAYPDRFGSKHMPDMTNEFRAFLQSLEALVGEGS